MFKFLARVFNNAENGILDFLSAFVPYCVPVIPAYLTYFHTHDADMMNFPVWVAITAAFVVETLGMASVSTAIKFWRNNQMYKSNENKAPFKLAFGVYLFYIVIVLTVNVMLEIVSGSRSGMIITAIALFSMLSFPSGILIAIRSQYKEILEERAERKMPRQVISQTTAQVERKAKKPSDYYDKIRDLAAASVAKNGKLPSPKEITAKLGLDHHGAKGYVSQTLTNYGKENGINKGEKPPFP